MCYELPDSVVKKKNNFFPMPLNILYYYMKTMMSEDKDTGEKSDESTSNVGASFTCEKCGKTFSSRQELKDHVH